MVGILRFYTNDAALNGSVIVVVLRLSTQMCWPLYCTVPLYMIAVLIVSEHRQIKVVVFGAGDSKQFSHLFL